MKNKSWLVETPVLRYFDWMRAFQLEAYHPLQKEYPDSFVVGYHFLSLMFDMKDIVDKGVVIENRISLRFSSKPSKQSVPVRVRNFGTLNGLRWKKEGSHRQYSFLWQEFEEWLSNQKPFCDLKRDESIIAHVTMYIHPEE
jgi:hypothetical protein